MNNLTILYAEILRGFQTDTLVALVAVFLDIKAAYDNVLINRLVNRVVNLDIPPMFCRFIYNLVSAHQVNMEK